MKTIKSKISFYKLLEDMPQELVNTIDDIIYEYAKEVAENEGIDFALCGFSQKLTLKVEIWEDKDSTE